MDFEKLGFVADVFSFLVQNLNLTALERKLETSTERDYIKMMWNECIPLKFPKFIYSKENFIQLSQPYISYQKANNIVKKLMEEENENKNLLRNSLKTQVNTIQYIYLLLFPKIYS